MAPQNEEFKKSEATRADVEREKALKENAGANCRIEEEEDKWVLVCEW